MLEADNSLANVLRHFAFFVGKHTFFVLQKIPSSSTKAPPPTPFEQCCAAQILQT